jgi:hypothetical protein
MSFFLVVCNKVLDSFTGLCRLLSSGVPAALRLNMFLAQLPVSNDWLFVDIFKPGVEFGWFERWWLVDNGLFCGVFVIDAMCPFNMP